MYLCDFVERDDTVRLVPFRVGLPAQGVGDDGGEQAVLRPGSAGGWMPLPGQEHHPARRRLGVGVLFFQTQEHADEVVDVRGEHRFLRLVRLQVEVEEDGDLLGLQSLELLLEVGPEDAVLGSGP